MIHLHGCLLISKGRSRFVQDALHGKRTSRAVKETNAESPLLA